ncbi:MAG: large subunit ribosomal protein L6 [Parcubacteria group bacterium Gr01-1014_48]|nr:MAG: large subunit ribosomal protein L6 [Parcubacteria group bacterium Greene0416_14]TSC72529.1 MAG: large subunit ribosomal protein L6 [Parcubacteria group bacterium Gr01-1014_48]TSD00583.1 MAG: large subunit ribosomal protein L6 [Parcubacteria group bacterium Greene1014_15]TSD08274.1 MAG: large subunit ribosomal protein L6 [Parcubacteria group bacterium Greene0714_4]
MSRIGKQIIEIPEKTSVTAIAGAVSVVGPLGTLSRDFKNSINIAVLDGEVRLTPRITSVSTKALWGTYAAHIANMIAGVNKVYEKKLIVEGIGFRSEVSGQKLMLTLGFSHPVIALIPEGIKVTAEKNVITITGIDKELVGQFAANVRSLKKPEPYKGKGIRYHDEVVRRKQGKKTA